MCHTGHLLGRPPPWPIWVLRVPTLNLLLLFASYYLLMPPSLHRTVIPIASLIPDSEAMCMCFCFILLLLPPFLLCRQPPQFHTLPIPCPHSLVASFSISS